MRKPRPVLDGPVALDAEAALFLEAIGEVVPTKADKKRAPPSEGARGDPVKVAQEESESLAQPALEQFILQARREAQRCVLVITGKGLNSEDQTPVLKSAVVQWLTRGRLSKALLAFCPAQPADGGSGALYVLLRR